MPSSPPFCGGLGLALVSIDPRFGEGDNFKRELIFTGAMPDTLTVSYREFINNLARPAFTEPLSIPLTKTFPQNISIKGHIIELIKIDGMGLHYTLKN